jgi:hypothetical protein
MSGIRHSPACTISTTKQSHLQILTELTGVVQGSGKSRHHVAAQKSGGTSAKSMSLVDGMEFNDMACKEDDPRTSPWQTHICFLNASEVCAERDMDHECHDRMTGTIPVIHSGQKKAKTPSSTTTAPEMCARPVG